MLNKVLVCLQCDINLSWFVTFVYFKYTKIKILTYEVYISIFYIN